MKTMFVICLALGCLWCAQSRAQFAAGDLPALGGASTNDTDILSDNGFEGHLKEKTYIYRGNVRVYNPQMTITCELLTIDAPDVVDGKYNHVVAETNVVITWWDEHGTNHATGDKVVYDYALTNLAKLPEKQYQTNSIVVLTGHSHLDLGGKKVDGDPILWNRVTDIISTPNMQRTTITGSNVFDISTSPKTNSHPK
jgi:lipopolysaccharide export system protein LptA